MTTNGQTIIDILSVAPDELRRYSCNVADYLDSHLDNLSDSLRGFLSSNPWLPESIKPKALPPPRKPFITDVTYSLHVRLGTWVLKNKIITGLIVVSLGGYTYHIIRRNLNRKKRKARRARDDSRLEVVVIAGQPGEPFTRSISWDLERRGFAVYILCSNAEEEEIVKNEARADIKPLLIDIKNPLGARSAIDRFVAHLQSPPTAFAGAKQHRLTMRSLIVIPTTKFPAVPIATMVLGTLSELLTTRLIQPIMAIQYFLPLLQNSPSTPQSPHPGPFPPLDAKPSIILLTPIIISSINPAFHAPEASITSALTSFASVLEQEVAPLSIPVTHLQLGSFDTSAFDPRNRQLTLQSQRAETLTWDEATRNNYGRNYAVSTTANWEMASHLRVLNSAVLDAMYSKRGGVVRVGSGSSIYGFVGKWVPRGLVSWMMGLKHIDIVTRTSSSTLGSGGGDGDIREQSQPLESEDTFELKDEEAFRDADVWTSGFESNIGNEGFQS